MKLGINLLQEIYRCGRRQG